MLGNEVTNKLGIDVATRDAAKLIKRLAKLKTTHRISNAGAYVADTNFTQVSIDTTWEEDELDDWLYKVNHGCEYVGTFTRG